MSSLRLSALYSVLLVASALVPHHHQCHNVTALFEIFQMILISLVNEYTDWSSQSETAMQRLESLMEILSDGLIVAPLVKTAILHRKHQQRRHSEVIQSIRGSGESLEAKTYSYVFSYQVCSHT